MAQKAGPMGSKAISRGDSGRTPGNPETSPGGRAVGKKAVNKLSRHIKVQVRGSQEGHKRNLVRPIHQGATFSQKFVKPKPRGVADQSRSFTFGSL